MTDEQIAEVCHEANRGLQSAVPAKGIPVAATWAEFPQDQKIGIISGVRGARMGATPEESHRCWCDFKVAAGWVYGEVKDDKAKTHPCLVGYGDLPPENKIKDDLFLAIVRALS
jgi:hypothetical protein